MTSPAPAHPLAHRPRTILSRTGAALRLLALPAAAALWLVQAGPSAAQEAGAGSQPAASAAGPAETAPTGGAAAPEPDATGPQSGTETGAEPTPETGPESAAGTGMAAGTNTAAGGQTGGGYLLGPRDTLTVRVGQWDAVLGAYSAWTDVSGTYQVSPDGSIALPLAGQIRAAGRSTTELSEDIAQRLGERLGLRDQIDAAVEITEFRPVYVVGAVNRPGAYPWTPGLTVLQALGLAGGMERSDSLFLRTDRTALTSLGSYEVLRLQLLRRLATAARLQAELEETEIEVPPELSEAAFGTELMQREREIKAARDAALESSLAQIADLEGLLAEQIERLGEQLVLRQRQLDLAEEELQNTADLVERGLSVASNRSALERLVADQQVRMLELETARLNAEQKLNEAGRDRLDIINNRRREVVEAVRAERTEIEELRVRMRTEAALYAEATRYEDGFIAPEGMGAPVLELTRRRGGETTVTEVTRMDEMQPGDVLEVRIPLLDDPTPGAAGGRPAAEAPPLDLPESLSALDAGTAAQAAD